MKSLNRLIIICALAALSVACASAPAPSVKGDADSYRSESLSSSLADSSASSAAAPSDSLAPEPSPLAKSSAPGMAAATEAEAEAYEDFAPPPAASPRLMTEVRPAAPMESGLKAGFADDNAQYNYYLGFAEENFGVWPFRAIPVKNRIIVRTVDESGAALANVKIDVIDASGSVVDSCKTYGDGQAIITPPEDLMGRWTITASILADGFPLSARRSFALDGPRELELVLPTTRFSPSPVPLDVVFVMDTTGSMGEEIERLKATIDIIRDNLDMAVPRPELRFGLVLYKDRGDEYIVRDYPLTGDMAKFRSYLAKADASGGGDEPEDLEAALKAAVSPAMGWTENGARLVFVITDAPAQAYRDSEGYDISAEKARAAAIKIHTVGTGGLPLSGEYQLRQIAQRTRGRYIFLTYGERGESGGGELGAVSHHTGANWTAERLEAIIIRFAKEELAYFSSTPVETPLDDWYEARSIGGRSAEDILDELFTETIGRLVDYSSVAVSGGTAAAIMPVAISNEVSSQDEGKFARNAERFGARLLQAAIAAKRFRLVERDDLQSVLAELELSMSAIGGEADVVRVGKLIGAEVLIAPTLLAVSGADSETEWELYIKLVRVDTAELLSVARAKIGYGLGID